MVVIVAIVVVYSNSNSCSSKFDVCILTVRVELPDNSLYDSGALGDMSSAYWHAVTGGVIHRASPPYSHVSGHAGAAGRVCGRPTALATSITSERGTDETRTRRPAAVTLSGNRRRRGTGMGDGDVWESEATRRTLHA